MSIEGHYNILLIEKETFYKEYKVKKLNHFRLPSIKLESTKGHFIIIILSFPYMKLLTVARYLTMCSYPRW